MRAILAITLLVACSRHDAPKTVSADDDVTEKCDPASPRVCLGNDVVACEPTGELGRRLRTCKDGCDRGHCKGQCSTAGAELVYAVDEDDDFLAFDPRKLPGDPFTVIGKLQCTPNGTPFSMAVDRNGTAWVLYSTGEVFEVSITDATCKKHATSTRAIFGMGYVSDTPNGSTETLFVSPRGSGTLGRFDDRVTRLTQVGPLTSYDGANPELTGTRDARLYGFYPSSLGAPFVQEIDKQTAAAIGPRWPLGDQQLDITAYAFAQWGGVFYVFVTDLEGGAAVHAVDKTGTYRIARDHVPYKITGAGVSTCAPERDGVSVGRP